MNERGSQPEEFGAWAEAMRGDFEEFLRETWKAMSAARVGRWIADTEEVMRQARDRLGQRAYEKLLQLRIDAGEAAVCGPAGAADTEGWGAFSPGGRPGGPPEQGPQGGDASDGGGTC